MFGRQSVGQEAYMKTAKVLALIACTALAFAQIPAKRPLKPDDMQQAIAQQRLSIQRQLGGLPQHGFFVLPPLSGARGSGSYAIADCDPLSPGEVDSLTTQAATSRGLDPDLLRAVMRQESGFRPCAVSEKGAMGLMQLMPETAAQFGIRRPFDPVLNVDGGARFLKALLTRYDGNLARALGAYNAGPAVADSAEGVPAIPETLDYVRQILARLPVREQ